MSMMIPGQNIILVVFGLKISLWTALHKCLHHVIQCYNMSLPYNVAFLYGLVVVFLIPASPKHEVGSSPLIIFPLNEMKFCINFLKMKFCTYVDDVTGLVLLTHHSEASVALID